MAMQQSPIMKLVSGAVRPVIEAVKPEISGGRYAVKRVVGDEVNVEATVVLDGHDILACRLLYRHESEKQWTELPMLALKPGKDRWEAPFRVVKPGVYFYAVHAWVDRFKTWQNELTKKHEAGQDVALVLRTGVPLVEYATRKARGADKAKLQKIAKALASEKLGQAERVALASTQQLDVLMARYPDNRLLATYDRELSVQVDRERAAFSAWYEFFPRSCSGKKNVHGTFKDAEKMIPYVASMGFDVIYLPPIHPIGLDHRKGKNNSLTAGYDDPGSPWGIGSSAGGHKSVHPELGTLNDFRRFMKAANSEGIEIALDIAFQCSPDHPYVEDHPEWFRKRPDGSIQYAENPPKKYQDIYPFHFESDEWPALWKELKSVILFWVKQGVKIFRVDNPHTKPVRFWQWVIAEIRKEHPEVLFLAEAFTRPAMMYHLGKIGFSQSYTYFTWRNTPAEMKKYLEELTQTEVADFYRPNFWPNTPDILPIHLQKGGRPAFVTRVALAATLSSNYGIYGPSYELGDNTPFHEGGEEYLDSEKYELKQWDINDPRSLRGFIAELNALRRENPALQRTANLHFHPCANEQVLCFSKRTADFSNVILVVANMDFSAKQSGSVELSLEALGLGGKREVRAQDLLKGGSVRWKGGKATFKLDPKTNPVGIFRISQE